MFPAVSALGTRARAQEPPWVPFLLHPASCEAPSPEGNPLTFTFRSTPSIHLHSPQLGLLTAHPAHAPHHLPQPSPQPSPNHPPTTPQPSPRPSLPPTPQTCRAYCMPHPRHRATSVNTAVNTGKSPFPVDLMIQGRRQTTNTKNNLNNESAREHSVPMRVGAGRVGMGV